MNFIGDHIWSFIIGSAVITAFIVITCYLQWLKSARVRAEILTKIIEEMVFKSGGSFTTEDGVTISTQEELDKYKVDDPSETIEAHMTSYRSYFFSLLVRACSYLKIKNRTTFDKDNND
jgi:hypothetical protein